MSWYEKLLDTAKDVAPTVAGGAVMAASGGNPALGALVSSIVGKLVGEPSPDLEKASQELLGDPKAISDFRKEMREAEIRELEIRAKDTQSAREILKHSKGPVVISTLTVSAFSVLVFLVMFVSIPASSQAVAYMLMGSLATAFTQVLNFWLGTSVGSKEKDNTISRFASAAELDQQARRKNER
jgi:hypothetical protein